MTDEPENRDEEDAETEESKAAEEEAEPVEPHVSSAPPTEAIILKSSD
ncbi:hypothetical protein [Gryllotalpicola koreensis]|uniref:Uncharacterized protein n=1 Tax=Gryllotalpicola koreensis TaxID=993086 RepID=A0ABP7ZPY4_9MICO